MKIWHISDTHGKHAGLQVPSDVDIIIHSGDFSHSKSSAVNCAELESFIEWYSSLPVKNKVLIAGNHDVSLGRSLYPVSDILSKGIFYLESSSVIIDGIKIWGSPYSPSFGDGWSFNKSRGSIGLLWDNIPADVDVLVTHGPPKTILDFNSELEPVGCASLYKKVVNLSSLKAHCFGHVHNNRKITNTGLRILYDVIYSNGSVISDGSRELTGNGNLFRI